MNITAFGKMPDGSVVDCISLSAGSLTAKILTYGSVLQDLRLDGHSPSLVLGFDSLEHYLDHSPYFGATAGRCANRIGHGHLLLEGVEYQLDQNFLQRHHLHGGAMGIGKRLWKIEKANTERVTLSIKLADGEMGYPGNMDVEVTYRLLPAGVLDICFEATTDKTTLCNLAHHSYFNLSGRDSILDHRLRVEAASFTPVDDELIPTGEVRSVTGSIFDLRQFKDVGSIVHKQGIDHNFCLSDQRQSLRSVAFLESPSSAVSMTVRTTEPGLQIYDGARVAPPVPGLDGLHMKAYAGIALEPQIWPDAIHHSHFPQAVLHSDEVYKQRTQYIFSNKTGGLSS
ncbi:MAG: galactose mutarotase [Gammaproteobacteria bacterium]|nr:galactose mutarotase [Gammaproteobacteria bacterium]